GKIKSGADADVEDAPFGCARDALAIRTKPLVAHREIDERRQNPSLIEAHRRAPRAEAGQPLGYIRKSRLALPLRILPLSSSHSGTVSIHCIAGLLVTKVSCMSGIFLTRGHSDHGLGYVTQE